MKSHYYVEILKIVVPVLLAIIGWMLNESLKRKHEIRMARTKWYEQTLAALDRLYFALCRKEYSEDEYHRASDKASGIAIWGTVEAYTKARDVLTSIDCLAKLYNSGKSGEEDEEFDQAIKDYKNHIDELYRIMRKDLHIKGELPKFQFSSERHNTK